MATSKKSLHDALRNSYMENVKELLAANGEEILITGSNEICIPCVDAEGNDEFLQIVFKIPTGSHDGDPFDGYSLAEAYAMKQKEKADKAKESAKKKAEKIAKDKAMREEKARLKAEREAKAEA